MSPAIGLSNLLGSQSSPQWVNRFCENLQEEGLSCDVYKESSDDFSKYISYGKHTLFPVLSGFIAGFANQIFFPFSMNVTSSTAALFSCFAAVATEYSLQGEKGQKIEWGKIASVGISCLIGHMYLLNKSSFNFISRISLNAFQSILYQSVEIGFNVKNQTGKFSFATFSDQLFSLNSFFIISSEVLRGEGFHWSAVAYCRPNYSHNMRNEITLYQKALRPQRPLSKTIPKIIVTDSDSKVMVITRGGFPASVQPIKGDPSSRSTTLKEPFTERYPIPCPQTAEFSGPATLKESFTGKFALPTPTATLAHTAVQGKLPFTEDEVNLYIHQMGRHFQNSRQPREPRKRKPTLDNIPLDVAPPHWDAAFFAKIAS